jgi:LmbE family N-acetylglucosaminyl deacetylase
MLKKQEYKENILVVCAHSDDQIIGAGGTLAKYAKEGKKIHTCIISYGESSHPHYHEEIISSIRYKEALDANKVIGGNGVDFLDIKEGEFAVHSNMQYIKEQLGKIIKKYNPKKIFTHSWDDFHPDHRATFAAVRDLIAESKLDVEAYSFDIWNPFTATNSNYPKLVVDISNNFSQKIKALHCFKSQKVTLFTLLPAVYVRGFINGLDNHAKYAEVFYRFL